MSWLALVVAQQILAQHPTIVTFCEPCGDRVPREPVQWAGEPVDPATTYVQTSPERFDNLAVLLGEPVDGVSPSLRVEAATSDGVLIVPDTIAHPPVAFEPPPVVVVEQTTHWGAIAVGCGATSALWLAALRLRRRRHHRPRLG
jgi:hypothetical protein